MRFVRLDGTSYHFDTRHRVVTPDDITQPVVYEKYWSFLQRVMCKIANLPEFGAGWHTLVLRNLNSAESPAVFILDYEKGTYTDPLVATESSTGDYVPSGSVVSSISAVVTRRCPCRVQD